MFQKDYYLILEIPQNATNQEIKKAYRGLAKKYHPDSSSTEGSEDIFSEITEAYKILSHPDKKKEYDASFIKPEPPPSYEEEFRPPPSHEEEFRPPPSHEEEFRPPPKKHHRARKTGHQGPKRIWREHNASLRYRERFFSRESYSGHTEETASPMSFYSYRRFKRRKYIQVGGVVVVMVIILFVWILWPPSYVPTISNLKGSQHVADFELDLNPRLPELPFPGRQQSAWKIRDYLYRELIIQPNKEDPAPNPENKSVQDRDPSSTTQGNLLEDIWEEIQ